MDNAKRERRRGYDVGPDDEFSGTRATRKVEYVVEWWQRDDRGYEFLHQERFGHVREAHRCWERGMKIEGSYGHDVRKAEFIHGARWVSESILTEDQHDQAVRQYLAAHDALHLLKETRDALRATTEGQAQATDQHPGQAPVRDPQQRGGPLERGESNPGGGGPDGLRPAWLDGE